MSNLIKRFFGKNDIGQMKEQLQQDEWSFDHAQLDKKLLFSKDFYGDLKADILFFENFMQLNPQSKWNIEQEIHFLTKYIDAWSASGNIPEVLFEKNIHDFSKECIGLILIPMVQNAFYFGSPVKSARPIKIKLTIAEKFMLLEVSYAVNPYLANPFEIDILQNFKSRLRLHYPNTHEMMCNSNSNTCRTYLKIFF